MSFDDVEYYRRRSFEERERAAKANTSEASKAHLELAQHYEGLVARADLLPLKRSNIADRSDARS